MANRTEKISFGSSPRVRGKLKQRFRIWTRGRIIPARAGQTPERRRPERRRPDHPRACGANARQRDCCRAIYGSSPRVRGKPLPDRRIYGRVRIIPARAGQTVSASTYDVGTSDHPRACGANADNGQTVATRNGSSPRVRGKLVQVVDYPRHGRIIPARAGQTETGKTRGAGMPDHPRACGANADAKPRAEQSNGSSPRVRGKLVSGGTPENRERIIPARAGQTGRGRTHGTPTPDHPRACGANDTVDVLAALVDGSSPRVRGKPVPPAARPLRGRIIPARAGQTASGTR